MTHAVANLDALFPVYKSEAERAWAAIGELILAADFEQRVMLTMYEPVALRLPGGSYKPDFMHILETGQVIFCEVKASKHQKNYRDARSKLRAAAEVYGFWTFVEARGGGENWETEVINP